jgi:hypothetical protein
MIKGTEPKHTAHALRTYAMHLRNMSLEPYSGGPVLLMLRSDIRLRLRPLRRQGLF